MIRWLRTFCRRLFATHRLKNCWNCTYASAHMIAVEPVRWNRKNLHEWTRFELTCCIDGQRVGLDDGCAAWHHASASPAVRLADASAHEKAALLFTKSLTYERSHRDHVQGV